MGYRSSGSDIFSKILRNIVVILFLVIFISIIYNFGNRESDTVTALMTEASASTSIKGVFIRDETVVTYSGSGVLSYSVPDGGRLGLGSVIAQVYDTDEQIKINREIESLTEELDTLNKIQNPGTVESAQPASLSSNIEEVYRNIIYNRDTGDYDSIKSNTEDFLVYLSTYQIITDEDVDFTTRISEINTRLAELESSTVAPIETITADRSAYFVSCCDGYEDILTKENIDDLTVELLNSVTDNTQETEGVVGKLIDGYEWYLAGVVDNSKKEYAIGDSVYLKFESLSEEVKAEIIDLRDEGDDSESIIILSCDQFDETLVQHRAENVDLIKGEYTGLKVPREAIRFVSMEEEVVDEETGITSTVTVSYKGVYIEEGEQVEFRKIDVIYEGSDYVLSAVHNDDSDYLALYDDIMIEGVDSDG
ncbi:MAG: hypothetical protein LUG91_10705 [Ruminococcus sp.]|nr:hypothetical protein [Ruminococcus sp.]